MSTGTPSCSTGWDPTKTGKACLYLKRLSDVDPDVLRTLVERSVRVARGVDR